jgi:hypothetical protein
MREHEDQSEGTSAGDLDATDRKLKREEIGETATQLSLAMLCDGRTTSVSVVIGICMICVFFNFGHIRFCEEKVWRGELGCVVLDERRKNEELLCNSPQNTNFIHSAQLHQSIWRLLAQHLELL